MTDPKTTSAATGAWAPYRPSPEAPWNRRRVVHLHRRAAFAATGEELERDLHDGPEASVERFLDGRVRASGVAADFERIADRIGDAAVDSRTPERLKAWWVFRMLLGPDPLGERLTLLWHDHFATSNRKVDDLGAMRRQNDLFRRHARAPFGTLLNAAVRDPALLRWLDAPANRKGHPNENLARELLELFTLGLGRFGEPDVKDAARALAGWTVADGRFVDNPNARDGGETLLGRSGRWDGSDLLATLLDHPATAQRLAGRLCGLFLGEGAVGAADVDELAGGLRGHGLDVGWGVATILRSRAFFAEPNLGARVVGPAEFVVGAVRSLELLDPPPSTLALAGWITRIGQDLFYPPNVGGWPGGRSWLSSRALIARANFAGALLGGREVGLGGPLDVLGLVEEEGESGLDRVVLALAGRLLGYDPGPSWRESIAAAAGAGAVALPESSRRAAALVLSSPESQLS